MFETIREDFLPYRHARRSYGRVGSWLFACCAYGFLASVVYRYGRWTRTLRFRPLAIALRLPYRLLKIPVELLLGIDISINADIGPGLFIGHFGGIFLHCNAGARLRVAQGVTLGYKGAGMSDDWPQLGDDVYIGAGAKVIGSIVLGDRVVVGANTVVTHDVPDDTRVVGAATRMTALVTTTTPRAERRLG